MKDQVTQNRTKHLFLRQVGALLVGGAFLLPLAGCGGDGKGGPLRDMVFWPEGPKTTESPEGAREQAAVPRNEPDAAPNATEDVEILQAPVDVPAPQDVPAPLSAEQLRTRDAGTSGYPEVSPGENLPAGRKSVDLPDVNFGLDVYELSSSQREALHQHMTYLRDNPRFSVILRGHTDESGTEEYNMTLGQRRAQSVRDALIESGVDPSRLDTVSFGEAMPIAVGEDEQSRSRNRRVEFFLYEPAQSGSD